MSLSEYPKEHENNKLLQIKRRFFHLKEHFKQFKTASKTRNLVNNSFRGYLRAIIVASVR